MNMAPIKFGQMGMSKRVGNQILQRDLPLLEKVIELLTNSDDSYRRTDVPDNDPRYPIDVFLADIGGTGQKKKTRSHLFVGVLDRSDEHLGDQHLLKAFSSLGAVTGDM